MKPASEKQLDFVKSLTEQKDFSALEPRQVAFLRQPELWANMNVEQASNAIKLLLDCPKIQAHVPEPTHEEVSEYVSTKVVDVETPNDGHYFIVDPTDDKEKFFRVKHGKEGTRWENWTFLDVQASDFWYPIKSRDHRDAVFAEINKDPVTAMNEYGMRLGKCGVCNRTLTDRDSRLRGIGPICAMNLDGYATDEELDLLKRLGFDS
jgi:hypothetical protein